MARRTHRRNGRRHAGTSPTTHDLTSEGGVDEQERGQTPDAAGEPLETGGGSAAREGATVSRSQHVVHVLPQDWSIIGQVLAPALERVNGDVGATQLLVLTRDPAASLAVADAALGMRAAEHGVEILPVTSVRRAA